MTGLSALFLAGLLLLLAALPSASVALVVTRSVTRGRDDGMAVAAGIVCADLLFVVLALLGMSFVAETLGPFFVGVRVLAGAYLVYLGLRLLFSGTPAPQAPTSRPGSSLLISFVSGFFLTLGDLKALVFYASLFPVLIDLQTLSGEGFFFILLLTALCVGGVKIAYALLAEKAYRHFGKGREVLWLRRTAGGLLAGSGVYLALKP